MPRPISAKNAKVRLEGQVVAMTEWRVRGRCPREDTTSFEDNGFGRQVGTIRQSEIQIRGFWDSDANLHFDPPRIVEGHFAVNLLLYTNDLASPHYNFPEIYIEEVSVFAVVRNGIKLDFNCFSEGGYFYPGVIA